MPGLVPGIHVLLAADKAWMAGTSPAMTKREKGHYTVGQMPNYAAYPGASLKAPFLNELASTMTTSASG